ncbi:DUF5682 family protein [Streptomyces sp. BI20]|uniref:DUF5682 family protein n=1 Tax=Streptomyces sp. BI20 TaxID=3403460 RepID=UPI003C78B9A3
MTASGVTTHGGSGTDGSAAGGPWLLGVRHHGPGSARAVRAALDALDPAAVLVEGPPEADPLLEFADDPDLRPPIALAAHPTDEPGRSVFWPFAVFSPEWVAIRWARERGRPARFFDLPAAHTLAWDRAAHGAGDGDGEDGVRADPLGALAEAAGHADPERWWEDVVEHRAGPEHHPLAPFLAVEEAMTALRERAGAPAEGGREAAREAHMRQRIRAARREFGPGIAVVCGAWHVPALRARTTVAADRALLTGLPRVRPHLSWVPWTHRRLARSGGYGAGIAAPGWYAHLFAAPDRPAERWLARIAALLREQDLHVSTAHVIEAVRFAEALAALRERPLPGLEETLEAARAVLCEGSELPLGLIGHRLVVGDDLGEVPAAAPAAPLRRDLDRLQRSLRLRPEAGDRELELDLRRTLDADRSRLLHRLRLLGVDWAVPAASRPGVGTFRETWRLRWEPELSVRVAEAGVWGTTVETAAGARVRAEARAAETPAAAADLARAALAAGLDGALPEVLAGLADRAALHADVLALADALPALARALRYGDVRGTDTGALAAVAGGLAERVRIGLPTACAGLDPGAAAAARTRLDAAHGAIGLLGDPGLADRWTAALRALADRPAVPGTLRGRAVRLLWDADALDADGAARRMSLALSPGTDPSDAAGWIEGFADGGGMLLVHDERLTALLDGWVSTVPERAFTEALPLLRRTFGGFPPAVRRALGEAVRRGPGRTAPAVGDGIPAGFAPAAGEDRERAAAIVPVVRLLAGSAR